MSGTMNLSDALIKLAELEHEPKFERMLGVCSILTQMLHKHGIEPTIVGGFAVDASHETRFSIYDHEGVGGFDDCQVLRVARFGVK
jgi:hypothetical protein